jgi:hypothetical protein
MKMSRIFPLIFLLCSSLVFVSLDESLATDKNFHLQTAVTKTEWESVVPPDSSIEELTTLDTVIFARSDTALYKSADLGASWFRITLDTLATQWILDVEVSDGTIYATIDGPSEIKLSRVIVSSDSGRTFKMFFGPFVDTPRNIDFEKDRGWLNIGSWGLYSGVNKLNLQGDWQDGNGDLPYAYQGVLNLIIADRLNPDSIAFTYGSRGDSGTKFFRTLNGGQNWLETESDVLYTTVIGGISYALGSNSYSMDRGETWKDFDFEVEAFLMNPAPEVLFAANANGGVYIGVPDRLIGIGLDDHKIQSFTIADDYLFAVSEEGAIFRTRLSTLTQNTPPMVVDTLSDLELQVGENSFSKDLSTIFSDADGDTLSYWGSTSDEAIATAIVSGNMLTITAVAVGTVTITVTANDGLGGSSSTSFTVNISTAVTVEQFYDELPKEFELEQNYPNPFNPKTTIRYNLPRAMHVTLTIYNLMGQEIATLVSDDYLAGRYETTWEAIEFASGVYVYQLQAGSFLKTRKMLLLK